MPHLKFPNKRLCKNIETICKRKIKSRPHVRDHPLMIPEFRRERFIKSNSVVKVNELKKGMQFYVNLK